MDEAGYNRTKTNNLLYQNGAVIHENTLQVIDYMSIITPARSLRIH
jgi:hypothetical protein